MKKRFCIALLALGVLASDHALAAARAESVMVFPARYRVVKLAFDVMACTGASMVSYQTNPHAADPLLHVWRGDHWAQISVDEYRSGSFLARPVEKVIVIGADRALPAALAEAPASATPIRIASLDIATLVSELDKLYDFSPVEWRWLAERNELKIVDVNENQRRYGRYGRPGAAPVPPPVPNVQGSPVPPGTPAEAPAAAPASEPKLTVAPIPVPAMPAAAPAVVKTPEAKAPEAKAPEVKAPEVKLPDTKTPAKAVEPVKEMPVINPANK